MSLTTGERQALTWLLAVIGVGVGVRLVSRRVEAGAATPVAGEALRRQLVAVDSAQRADQRRANQTRQTGGSRRRAAPRTPRADDRGPADTAGPADGSVFSNHVPTLLTVDVDLADSAALERLPRIGPALAARIVADRRQQGPFGSLAALQRVRGIGPKLAASVAGFVTFTGTPRPSAVQR